MEKEEKMGKVTDFVEEVIGEGLLCEEYKVKFHEAASKKQLMDIVLDANGISFIQEMAEKGHRLPYEYIIEEFGNYINGAYVRDYDGYTSEMYCKNYGDIDANCTATVLLGCKGTVKFSKAGPSLLYCENCDISVECARDARVYVKCWGDTEVDTSSGNGNVIFKKR